MTIGSNDTTGLQIVKILLVLEKIINLLILLKDVLIFLGDFSHLSIKLDGLLFLIHGQLVDFSLILVFPAMLISFEPKLTLAMA